MQDHCLYCGADAITRIAEVEVARLIEVYRKGFGVDVERLFSDTSARLTLVSCRTCELRWFSPLVAGDDRFYEDLQKLPWYYQDDKPEYGYASQHILPGDAVLEVGCGKGAFAPFLANGVQYRGLEFNQLAVDKARGAGLDVEACSIAAEAERVPASYDVVCHFQVLEHVSAPRAFLVDCVRALRPGGRLIITVPSEDSFLSIAEDAWLNMPPHHVTRWTDSALRFALAKLQLEAQEIWHEPVASFHAAWYRDVLINFGVKRLFGGRTVLASTHRGRRIARLVRLLGQTPLLGDWVFASSVRAFSLRNRGHSVCVVARKPMA